MQRASHYAPAGAWPAVQAADSLVLAFDDRYRRRLKVVTAGGDDLLVDLPAAVAMADGDGLKTDAGDWIAVRAADEPLIRIYADGPAHLARIAWHIGNRHLPAQITVNGLLIRPDHVIEAMVRGLGGHTETIHAPFQPEGGAYGSHGHAHGHGHDHDHDHDHDGDHGHGHHGAGRA